MVININSTAVVQHTNRLEKLHRSALPNAVRNTLNNAVFDVKTKTMPKQAKEDFVKRSPNFFKSQSKFENAKGFNVNTMKATVGFIEGGLKGGNNYAVRDLEEQEHGGRIEGKSFIPLKTARNGFSSNKLVRENARLTNIDKIIDARKIVGKYHNFTKRQQFGGAVMKAGKGGYVLSGPVLWKIDLIIKREGKRIQIYKTALYNFKRDRSVNVTGKHFMETSSVTTAKKMEDFFIKNAMKQIEKLR